MSLRSTRISPRSVAIPLIALLLWPAGVVAVDLAERHLLATVVDWSRVRPIPVWPVPALFPITVTAEWHKVRHAASARALRADRFLWRQMHLDDWDQVPSALREQALRRMFTRYAALLSTPDRWQTMAAHDWDAVPHPVRVVAFVRMLAHWRAHYDLGAAHGLPARFTNDTIAAVVMAESYFEHRSLNINQWGNRDLGLAAASDSARRKLSKLHAAGVVDFTLRDEDYFNPWHATRFVVVWTGMLLSHLDGDIDRVIGAYHRGERNACDEKGLKYRGEVERRRRFFQDRASGPPTWRYVWFLAGDDLAAIDSVL